MPIVCKGRYRDMGYGIWDMGYGTVTEAADKQYTPTKVVFGKGAEEKTGKLLKDAGASRAFVVYGGGSVVKNGREIQGYGIWDMGYGTVTEAADIFTAIDSKKLRLDKLRPLTAGEAQRLHDEFMIDFTYN